MSDKTQLLHAATKIADWMVRTQVNSRLDANSGRFMVEYSKERGISMRTTGWDTGCALMGLLAAWKRTGKKEYLDAAERAGHYIMSLQFLDARKPLYYGAFHEVTPQSVEFCPRDATSAAWALCWLYEATKDLDYLDRAVLFGNWMLEYGMVDNWPRWAVMTDGQNHFYARGSFQSGVGLFFYDLFMQTHDPRYIDRGLHPIADIYCRDFLNADGSVTTRRDLFTGEIYRDADGLIEMDMHNYNDDFGCAMLLKAAELFADTRYRDAALRFARFLMRSQEADGGFAGGRFPSAVPQALIYFNDLGNLCRDEELLSARDRTADALLKMQFNIPDVPELDGAFPAENHPGEAVAGMRCTMYALSALLHVESDQPGVWLGAHNAPFRDPLLDIEKSPLVFKW